MTRINCPSAFNFREKSAVPERFYHILEDHERMMEALKASDLEWVAVLPPHITGEIICYVVVMTIIRLVLHIMHSQHGVMITAILLPVFSMA